MVSQQAWRVDRLWMRMYLRILGLYGESDQSQPASNHHARWQAQSSQAISQSFDHVDYLDFH